MRASHITGCSRPQGEVGLTPRQYTEWNVAGRTRSAGDPSQQGLLPEVYHTASTGRCAHLHDRMLNELSTRNQLRTDNRPQVLCPGGIYSWQHSTSLANRGRSHDCAPVTWAYGVLCPALVVIYSW